MSKIGNFKLNQVFERFREEASLSELEQKNWTIWDKKVATEETVPKQQNSNLDLKTTMQKLLGKEQKPSPEQKAALQELETKLSSTGINYKDAKKIMNEIEAKYSNCWVTTTEEAHRANNNEIQIFTYSTITKKMFDVSKLPEPDKSNYINAKASVIEIQHNNSALATKAGVELLEDNSTQATDLSAILDITRARGLGQTREMSDAKKKARAELDSKVSSSGMSYKDAKAIIDKIVAENKDNPDYQSEFESEQDSKLLIYNEPTKGFDVYKLPYGLKEKYFEALDAIQEIENNNYALLTEAGLSKTEEPKKGVYSKDGIKPLSCNGIINNSQQGQEGDCWLLSTINALKDTQWGANAIKKAVKSDGKGGAIIRLQLGGGKTKVYHVTQAEIKRTRARGLCSTGDDDMAALEIAFRKQLGSIDGGGDEDKVVAMLCGKTTTRTGYKLMNDNIEKLLNEIEKNPGKYAATIGIDHDTKHLYGNHAYQIKRVSTDTKGNKWVYVVNPWDSSKTIKVSLKEIKGSYFNITISEVGTKSSTKTKPSNERNTRAGLNLIMAIIDENTTKAKEIIDKTPIMTLFYDVKEIDSIISLLDVYKSGWGNGKAKKELIAPLVDKLCAKARQVGVPSKLIQETKNTCYKELDATFYTDEKVIISALEKLYRSIKQRG